MSCSLTTPSDLGTESDEVAVSPIYPTLASRPTTQQSNFRRSEHRVVGKSSLYPGARRAIKTLSKNNQ